MEWTDEELGTMKVIKKCERHCTVFARETDRHKSWNVNVDDRDFFCSLQKNISIFMLLIRVQCKTGIDSLLHILLNNLPSYYYYIQEMK